MQANPELKDLVGEMEDLLEEASSADTKTSNRPSRVLAMHKRQQLEADVDEEADKKEFQAFMESEIKKTGPATPAPFPAIKTIIIDKDRDAMPELVSAPANIFATPTAPSSKPGVKKKKYIKR